MKADTSSTESSASSREQFFESNYLLLRDQQPMKWMGRFFLELTEGRCPKLVDLPTGTGKTEVVVIWALALAWYGLDAKARSPVPRRLVWVVNRRVLVQQVFDLADKLQGKLCTDSDSCSLREVREGLARLSGDQTDIFRVVQLRGQLVDDREWSVAPTVPQLVIGTVDQIGSRLMFQGYGLGKWSRPLQAALLGVDAWICVDEAHLVLAFVLTLRQFRRLPSNNGHEIPQVLSSVFDRLPFWMTELSATPSLPPPPAESVFRLLPTEENDPRLKDRLLAARTRRVQVVWLAETKKRKDEQKQLEESLTEAAAALDGKVGTVAAFVRLPGVAGGLARQLGTEFKGRVLKITGRIRGYERDRLQKDRILDRFRCGRDSDFASRTEETVFLVGTAAAEVGLDADSGAIVCDFASLTTLLQRLGRLDRRGYLSRRFAEGQCGPPTMTVFATREQTKRDIRRRMLQLARALRGERAKEEDPPASLLVGTHWNQATAKQGEREPTEAETDSTGTDDAEAPAGEDKKPKRLAPAEIISAATWAVLLGRRSGRLDADNIGANPPSTWLKRPMACVTGGPVAVPPLTTAVIEHWSGTTESRNAFLPVHPFLYGILPDEEGTPLVSVAFRLEMDAVAAVASGEDEEEGEGQAATAQVKEIFRQFPPRRAEFHLVSLATARDWLSSAEASGLPVAHFDGEEWSVTSGGGEKMFLQPNSVLILPTLAGSHHSLGKLLEDASDTEVASWDVLEGVSTQRPSYWRRVTQVESGDHRLECQDGASRIEQAGAAEQVESVPDRASVGVSPPDPPPGTAWRPRWQRSLRIGTGTFRFEYLKPKREVPGKQPLDEHLATAEKDADRIAGALAPGNEFLLRLLVEAAKVHDVGKRNPKWQLAMGNREVANPVAKPLVERPSSTGRFRHEWESFLEMRTHSPIIPISLSESERQDWCDLWCHIVASHHGHLRPWLAERVLEAHALGKQKQSALRLESAERFVRLQRLLGPWRLAYLEAVLRAADVAASQTTEQEESDEQ